MVPIRRKVVIVGESGCGKTSLLRYARPLSRNIARIAKEASVFLMKEFPAVRTLRYVNYNKLG
jgi:ABC-type lipoprotein export system ATPase subunit